MRLSKDSVKDIIELLKEHNSYLTEEMLDKYCNVDEPVSPSTHIYGYYDNGELVSIMTATFCFVFPHKDSPSGRIVQISGAYTKEEYRHRKLASMLLHDIEEDAKLYFDADYLCCDSTADNLYLSSGFEESSESRLWKKLK